MYSIVVFLLLSSASHATDITDKRKLAPIKHIVVFYLENHSFDNLMGTFPGADGIADAGDKAVQVDATGKPYETLPRALKDGKPDHRFPSGLPNKPFLITRFVPSNDKIGDLVHRYYQQLEQTDGDRMDRFVQAGDTGALTMGYYSEKDSPLWQYAERYTLADHFHTAAIGGSMHNHFWLACACTPRYEHAPASLYATLDDKGRMLKDGALTPDGYVVNTIQPFYPPYDPKEADPARRLPPLTLPTIGDRLSERHVSWAWYGGDWAKAEAGETSGFLFHHHPFNYFANYAPGTKARKEHLLDEKDFVAAIESGTLPAVSFFKPAGSDDMHPGYTHLDDGERHVFGLVKKIEDGPQWDHTLIIVTFDDAGGFWDHVVPPKDDRFGPGERVPTLLISPFVKKGYIDHTQYDTTSILKLIETRFSLKPLGDRDAHANNLLNALE